MQHRETQFVHDARKKEREYNRLKERLGQVDDRWSVFLLAVVSVCAFVQDLVVCGVWCVCVCVCVCARVCTHVHARVCVCVHMQQCFLLSLCPTRARRDALAWRCSMPCSAVTAREHSGDCQEAEELAGEKLRVVVMGNRGGEATSS